MKIKITKLVGALVLSCILYPLALLAGGGPVPTGTNAPVVPAGGTNQANAEPVGTFDPAGTADAVGADVTNDITAATNAVKAYVDAQIAGVQAGATNAVLGALAANYATLAAAIPTNATQVGAFPTNQAAISQQLGYRNFTGQVIFSGPNGYLHSLATAFYDGTNFWYADYDNSGDIWLWIGPALATNQLFMTNVIAGNNPIWSAGYIPDCWFRENGTNYLFFNSGTNAPDMPGGIGILAAPYGSTNFVELSGSYPIVGASSSAWANAGVFRCNVQKLNGTYFLFCNGHAQAGNEQIGLFTAPAITGPYAAYHGNPVITNSLDGFDHMICGDPQILQDEQDLYHMIYCENTIPPALSGYATSPDLTNWTKDVNSPISFTAGQLRPYLVVSNGVVFALSDAGTSVSVNEPVPVPYSGSLISPAGVINVSKVTGTFSGNGSGLTGLTAAQAGAVSTNMNALLQTNIYNLDGEIVVPWVHPPPGITNSDRYFGPWLGPNYVQLAVNSLTNFSGNKMVVGGGQITVIGTNYLPTTLLITNSLNGIMSVDLSSPTFKGGALVCLTNPCIRVNGNYANHSNQITMSFTMHNLIVASTAVETTNVFELLGGVDRFDVSWNVFGYWGTLTNNYIETVSLPSFMGLVTSSYASPALSNADLVVYLHCNYGDMCELSDNSFLNVNCLDVAADHLAMDRNFFSYCGNGYNNGRGATDWRGLYSMGSSVIVNNAVLSNGDMTGEHNYFYQCGGSYAVMGVCYFTSIEDCYEGGYGGQVAGDNGNQATLIVTNGVNAPFVLNARGYDGQIYTINPDYSPASSYANPGNVNFNRYNGVTGVGGNWNVASNLTAAKISGNGAGLTNVIPAGTLAGRTVTVTAASPNVRIDSYYVGQNGVSANWSVINTLASQTPLATNLVSVTISPGLGFTPVVQFNMNGPNAAYMQRNDWSIDSQTLSTNGAVINALPFANITTGNQTTNLNSTWTWSR